MFGESARPWSDTLSEAQLGEISQGRNGRPVCQQPQPRKHVTQQSDGAVPSTHLLSTFATKQ